MARLTKPEIAAHRQAEALLTLDKLNDDQRQFVLDNWQESANHINGEAAAFFTPSDLALDAALFSGCNTSGRTIRVIDLCAGIGTLGLAAWWRANRRAEVTCVEINPAYVEVGRKVFPEARWIVADVANLPPDIARGGFDVALANPPFGSRAKIKGPRFSGEDALAVVDIASRLARMGGFIMPSGAVPFAYSGQHHYQLRESRTYERFHAATGLELSCESIDCSCYAEGWKGVKPSIEFVTADFDFPQERAAPQLDQLQLFAA
jgi:predicted RNA methylase